MTDIETHTMRPDFHLVVEPHNLEYWNLPEHIDKIESIETVWLFDRNVHVHCCELTPSFEMWPVKMPGDTPRHVRILDNGGTDHALSTSTQPCIPGATRAVLAVLPGMRSLAPARPFHAPGFGLLGSLVRPPDNGHDLAAISLRFAIRPGL